MNSARFRPFFRLLWSTACVIICVALMWSWMRTYRYQEYLQFPSLRFTINSEYSRLAFTLRPDSEMPAGHFAHEIEPDDVRKGHESIRRVEGLLGFYFRNDPGGRGFHIPHWFAALLFAAFAAVPWIRWRWSLLALVVVMTCITAALGALAYAAK